MITRENYVAGLRAAADFYEQHPEIAVAAEGIMNGRVRTQEEAQMVVRALGVCNKKYSNSLLTISKEVAPGFSLEFIFSRNEVCERVVVGTTTVAAHTLHVPEKTHEDVVWRCAPLLAATEAK